MKLLGTHTHKHNHKKKPRKKKEKVTETAASQKNKKTEYYLFCKSGEIPDVTETVISGCFRKNKHARHRQNNRKCFLFRKKDDGENDSWVNDTDPAFKKR